MGVEWVCTVSAESWADFNRVEQPTCRDQALKHTLTLLWVSSTAQCNMSSGAGHGMGRLVTGLLGLEQNTCYHLDTHFGLETKLLLRSLHYTAIPTLGGRLKCHIETSVLVCRVCCLICVGLIDWFERERKAAWGRESVRGGALYEGL